jgi:plasmid maintenance system antidote protein VapI
MEYALYHGEEFLGIGTAEQLAIKFGKTADFIKWLAYPTALKRYDESNGNRYITVKLGKTSMKINRTQQLARDYERERIRNYMDDHDFTRAGFAEILGWSPISLSNYLSTHAGLPSYITPKVVQVIGLTEEQLQKPLGPDDYK